MGDLPIFDGRTVCIRAPADLTADVQERHLAIYHTLCALIEETMFAPGAAAANREKPA